ncbi:MAG TPA: cell wall-active antibiotics response protein LiaF [Bacteroidota bacterium]|nr:cell wall-active antibiotics response protein LiaF [Bacteroidota bacterium]
MRNFYWGFILILFGFLLLLDNLGAIDFKEFISDYWPLLLILWGVSILARRRPRPAGASPTETSSQTESELVHQSSVFGNIDVKVTSQQFKGGSISTVFGESFLDLSSTKLAEGEHELRVHGVFGDSRILLPADAAAAISASSVFGELVIFGQRKGGFSSEIQHLTPNYPQATNRMKISITRVFGNINVA